MVKDKDISEKARKIISWGSAILVALFMFPSVFIKIFLVNVNPENHEMLRRGGIYDIRYYLAVADSFARDSFLLPAPENLDAIAEQ